MWENLVPASADFLPIWPQAHKMTKLEKCTQKTILKYSYIISLHLLCRVNGKMDNFDWCMIDIMEINSLQIYLFSFKWMVVYKKWVDLQAISEREVYIDLNCKWKMKFAAWKNTLCRTYINCMQWECSSFQSTDLHL